MKKIALYGFACLAALAAVPALAADMAVKAPAPPPPAPASNWTGFYIGVDGGYGWNNGTGNRLCYGPGGFFSGCVANISADVIRPEGWLAGGQVGYNWQSGISLLGIETDFQWSDINASNTVPIGVPGVSYTASANMDWFGTTRIRVGILPSPNLLVYATGGFIYANESVSTLTLLPAGLNWPTAASFTRGGAVAGGGVEYKFAGNFSAKIEGLVYDMGSVNTNYLCPAGALSCTPGYTEGGTFALQGWMLRGGLNWQFNFGGAPVAARY